MPQQKAVPIGESLKYGWNTMKQNLGFFILLLVVYYAISLLTSFIPTLFADNTILYILIKIVGSIIGLLLTLGFIHITLSFIDNKKPTVGELFSQSNLLGQAILLYILYTLIVIAGFILLIVPGIIWSIKYSQAFYLLVDRKMSATDALRKSAEVTQGVKMELFGFGIVAGLITLAGALALIVGLFAAIPTTMLATAFVYRRILSQTEAGATTVPAPPTA